MYITIVSILTLLVVLAQTSQAYATTNSTSNVNVPLESQIHKLIENPFFAPDGSCLFDAYQWHCIPGDHQECPEGYGNNEDYTCFPTHEQCPDGYHSADDDETGQCYPDTEPCYPGQIRYPDSRSCGDDDVICEKYNVTGCTIDGRLIGDYPDEYCLTSPAQDKCAATLINGTTIGQCPEGFAVVNIQNFSTPSRCLPESVEDVEIAERERQVFDPNRCAPGYELKVGEHVDIFQRGGDIGTCNKID